MGYLIIGIVAFLLGWWIRGMECAEHEHNDKTTENGQENSNTRQ